MPEAQPQCQYCGYPVETGEHAVGCPNREVGDQEALPDPELIDITEQLQTLEAERSERVSSSRIERMKRSLNHLAEIGFISLALLSPLKEGMAIERVSRESQQQSTNTAETVPFWQQLDTQWQQSENFTESFEHIAQELHEAQGDLDYLRDIYGDSEYQLFMNVAQDNFKRRALGQIPTSPEVITGFEGTSFESEAIKKIFTETYPEHWIRGDIDSIIYRADASAEERSMAGQYNLGEGWVKAGQARGKDTGPTSIDLYLHEQIDELLSTANHEFMHANDWLRDNQMTIPERAELLTMVTKRFLQGENRYITEYVQAINDSDSSAQLYNQVTEYWAEIGGAYLSNPSWFQSEYPEDFALVDNWVKRKDPNYDVGAASQSRSEYMRQVIDDERDRAWALIPPQVRTAIEELKQTEIERAYEEWLANGGQGISEEFLHFMQGATRASHVDFNLIFPPIAEEIVQASRQRIEQSLTDFSESLSDREKESLAVLANQVSRQLEDPERWGEDILDQEIARWQKQYSEKEYSPNMIKEYLFSVTGAS